MDIFAHIASVAQIAGGRVKHIDPRWRKSPLDVEPFGIGSHVVIAGYWHTPALRQGHDALGDIQPEKLRQVGPNDVSRGKAAKQGRRRDDSIHFGPAECRALREVYGGN